MGERLIGGMTRHHDREGNCGRKGIVDTVGYGRERGIVGEAKHMCKDGDHGSCGILWEEQCPVGMTGNSGKTRL